MKTITLASTLVFLLGLSAWAQGVHLLPGQSLSIEFNGVGRCYSGEGGSVGGIVYVVFGNDILVPGEQLSLEMFEDDVNEPAVASQVYILEEPDAVVGLSSPGSWLDYQGFIRVNMLSGSVEVDHANFFVQSDPYTYCRTTVLVPEPRTGVLLALGGIVLATVLGYRQPRGRTACKCIIMPPLRY